MFDQEKINKELQEIYQNAEEKIRMRQDRNAEKLKEQFIARLKRVITACPITGSHISLILKSENPETIVYLAAAKFQKECKEKYVDYKIDIKIADDKQKCWFIKKTWQKNKLKLKEDEKDGNGR